MMIFRSVVSSVRAAGLLMLAPMLVHCFAMTTSVTASDGGTGRPDGSLSDGDTASPGVDTGSGSWEDVVSADGGGEGDSGVAGDAASPPGVVTSCLLQDHVTVGSYVVETDYWNQTACPGTQCVAINDLTGAFTVTQAPSCGSTVASYPNILYGSSFGTISPGAVLPRQVSALTSVTSSWSFSVSGASTDAFDVAYDIWFCPTDTCGTAGFNGGAELMIWLNYPNTSNPLTGGPVTLDGYSWEISSFAAGGTGDSWTYVAYMIQPTMVTSVTNLNLLAFFQNAVTMGYIDSSWYLYAVQAGIEVRTGGAPFTNTSFSVSVE